MPEQKQLIEDSFKMKAGETTLNQHCCAVLDTDTEGQCKRAAGANAGNIAGVLLDYQHEATKSAAYRVAGIALVKISAAVVIGDMLVISGADGRVAPKGTGAHASGTGIVGRAISAATSANSLVKCVLAIPNEYSS